MQNIKTTLIILSLSLGTYYTVTAQTFQKEIIGSENGLVLDMVQSANDDFIIVSRENEKSLKLSKIDGKGNHKCSTNIELLGSESIPTTSDLIMELEIDENENIYILFEMFEASILIIINQQGDILAQQFFEINFSSIELMSDGYLLTALNGNTLSLLKFNNSNQQIWYKTINDGLSGSNRGVLVTESRYDITLICYTQFDSQTQSQRNLIIKINSDGEVLKSVFTSVNTTIDTEIDSEGNFILYQSTNLLKLDQELNVLWNTAILSNTSGVQKSSDKLTIDNEDNLIVSGLGVNTLNNPTIDLVTYKYNKNGQAVFSKLLLDNIHRISNGFYKLDTSFILITENINSLQTIRKLNNIAEAEDCGSFDYCIEIPEFEIEAAPISVSSSDQSLVNLKQIELAVTPSDLILEHTCSPVDLPSASFELEIDSVCIDELIQINLNTIYPFGSSQWFLYDSERNLIHSDLGKLPDEIKIDLEGSYNLVHNLNVGFCNYMDSFNIFVYPRVNKQLDTIFNFCEDSKLELDLDNNRLDNIMWSNGINGTNFYTEESGIFEVSFIDDNQCKYTESFLVNELPLPHVQLVEDTILCSDISYSIVPILQNSDKVEWQDGSNDDIYEITDSGIYSITATNSCGSVEVSSNVEFIDCKESIYVPNIFNPSEDGENSAILLHAFNVTVNGFKVYDRWGSVIYSSLSSSAKWNGRINGRLSEKGVYTYILQYTTREGVSKSKFGTITLI